MLNPSRTRRFLGLLLAASTLAASPAFADALVDNVEGVTLDKDGREVRFTGILIADGKVVRLLKQGEKRPDRLDWRADMRGRIAIPGMIDAHGHVMDLGFRAMELDLFPTTSLQQAQSRIAAFAAANQTRPWILGGGWNQEVWNLGRFPTAAEIDAIVTDRPVWMQRADGHAGWANSAAMRAAGITAKTVSPAGGRIEKLPNGQPSGVFVDAAMDLIVSKIPKPIPRDRNTAFLKAQEALLSAGITATADMGTTVDDWLTYRRMGDQGLLRVRIMSYAAGVDTALAVAGQGPTPWLYADRLRMGGIKLYADGALGSRGAWLKQPYGDSPKNSGLGFLKDDQLLNLMSRGSMDNFQIAVHAIGDRANQQVLDAIDEMAVTYKGDRRWRIEHAQIVDPVDLPRFGKNGVIASMQPVHESSDWRMAEARLGAARLGGAYAWNSMLKAGSRLAFGSDYPVENPNPFVNLAVAITRQDANGQPIQGWRPEERVTLSQAWQAFTQGAAYAGFAEEKFGTLAVGQRADFLIVDRDPTEAGPTALRQTQVLETWVGGEKMWERK
ncbi:amidohydrolase [Sphingomonas floccifaciens]|uniref:Amidohydrolase n=1 Tax=Sphingomonas floccifaciens TaxID=1844115 RepID=A0ABW4N9J3_9SPHN